MYCSNDHVPLAVMESSRTCPWPRGSSRTISIVLGLGLVGYVLGLGLADKVLEFTKDTPCINPTLVSLRMFEDVWLDSDSGYTPEPLTSH